MTRHWHDHVLTQPPWPHKHHVSLFVWRSYCEIQISLCQNIIIQNVHLWLISHLNAILKGIGDFFFLFICFQWFPPYYSPMNPILNDEFSCLAETIEACSSWDVLLGSVEFSWMSCCCVLRRNSGSQITMWKDSVQFLVFSSWLSKCWSHRTLKLFQNLYFNFFLGAKNVWECLIKFG